ncbi:hypothetical protein N9Z70_03630 [Mariniblastus sp.]|nr:hypothetical protein [Mariniblastus sp.]
MDNIEEFTPRLEKRILPLLDVALTLVGMLILLVAVSDGQNPEGNAPQPNGGNSDFDIIFERDGGVQIGNRQISDRSQSPDGIVFDDLENDLNKIETPFIKIYFPAANEKSSKMNIEFYKQLRSWLAERQYNYEEFESTQ